MKIAKKVLDLSHSPARLPQALRPRADADSTSSSDFRSSSRKLLPFPLARACAALDLSSRVSVQLGDEASHGDCARAVGAAWRALGEEGQAPFKAMVGKPHT
eukprot:3067630-Rhodomonas_salina.1